MERLRTITLPVYSSGNGNGIFGLGWQLALPRITRRTEKGLPRYDDGDVFVLSGSEDLVRCLQKVVDPESGRMTWVPQDPVVRLGSADRPFTGWQLAAGPAQHAGDAEPAVGLAMDGNCCHRRGRSAVSGALKFFAGLSAGLKEGP